MWNFACGADGPNCIILDNTNPVDFDFGGPAIVVDGGEGYLLIAGQKSGDLWALIRTRAHWSGISAAVKEQH